MIPIFSSVFRRCFLFTPVPSFLHQSGPGLLEAGPWEGLNYHLGTPPLSLLSGRPRWGDSGGTGSWQHLLFPEVRGQEEEWGGCRNARAQSSRGCVSSGSQGCLGKAVCLAHREAPGTP